LIHGASDDQPGWYVDRLGDYLLSQSEQPIDNPQQRLLAKYLEQLGLKGAYHKHLDRHVRKSSPEAISPALVLGEAAPARFENIENGESYWLSFD
jgi:23S rRNA G2069 N7-methylase RlmK/C1962 C5-methylase RlmI